MVLIWTGKSRTINGNPNATNAAIHFTPPGGASYIMRHFVIGTFVTCVSLDCQPRSKVKVILKVCKLVSVLLVLSILDSRYLATINFT